MSEFLQQATERGRAIKAAGGSMADFDAVIKPVLNGREMRYRVPFFKRLDMLKQARAIFTVI